MKNRILTYIMCLLATFILCSCNLTDETAIKDENKTFSTLTRSTFTVQDGETLTVDAVRVLVFDANGNKVSNTTFDGTNVSYSNDEKNNTIISFDNVKFETRMGSNIIYVVLNENAFGANLTTALNAVTNVDEMEVIRTKGIAFSEVIAVPEGNELPFLMCAYDTVNVTSGSESAPSEIDMTGLTSDSYAFNMRRSMAKVVIESIEGGVDMNGNPITDQNLLTETSAIHILDVELINVPDTFYWNDDEIEGTSNKFVANPYNGAYLYPRGNGFNLGVSSDGSNTDQGYYEREWNGEITVSGSITFTRTDMLETLYKTNSNSSSYGLIPAYIFTYDYANDPDHYFLNMGNFADFYFNTYIAGGNYVPGPYTPKKWDLSSIQIQPSTWTLSLDKQAYYIPENITTDKNNQTAIRIRASIATPTAYITDEEINKIIDEAIKNNNYNGGIVGEGNVIQVGDKDALKVFLGTKGQAVPDPDGSGKYAIAYYGVQSIFEATTSVTNQSGFYAKIVEGEATRYLDIVLPLYNDNTGDANVYRGYEYKVKLRINKSPNAEDSAWTSAEANRSVTYHELPLMTTRGGESDLCIAAEVIATPVE